MTDFHHRLEEEIPRFRRYARALTRNAVRADDLPRATTGGASAECFEVKFRTTALVADLTSISISLRSDSRPRDRRDGMVPIGTSRIVAASSVAHPFESNQENYLALLFRKLRKRVIQLAQLTQNRRIGRRSEVLRAILQVDSCGIADSAPDSVYIPVVHDGKEPGAQIGAGLP
jgi:hypothetical protein